MSVIDTYLEFLKKVSEDANYTPTPEERTAAYSITRDSKYRELNEKLSQNHDVSVMIDVINSYKQNGFIKKEEPVESVPVINPASIKKPKTLTYKNPDLNNKGFGSLLFISLLMLVVAFIIFMIKVHL